MRLPLAFSAMMLATPAFALDLAAPFDSIDGGTFALSQWAGRPVLVVNTASRCGFTRQYSAMQDLYDAYRDRGLVVVAVPSNDFKQELGTNAQVKDFCELQYGIDLPMAEITAVTGKDAHPFYSSLKAENGFVPNWNFNKVLIGPDGAVLGTFRSAVKPMSSRITDLIEAAVK